MKISNLDIGPYTKRFQTSDFPNKFILHHDIYDLYYPLSSITNLQNKKILDFGGSFGNLLISSQGNIKEENYTCLDVDVDTMIYSKKKYPKANWLYRNLYNSMYNPYGKEDVSLNEHFDIIFAYSVFTHDTYESMINYINFFQKHLYQNGIIIISFYTYDNFADIMNKRLIEYGNCEIIDSTKKYQYLVNNRVSDKIVQNIECDYLSAFYNENFIEKLGKIIKLPNYQTFLLVDRK